jgi:meso-butanediol dehydrogenase / (S,S)-butanediol dehydrogenase / diacetyl reductase
METINVRLENRVALITGGGSGIGRAIAELFAREGAKVVAADRYLDRAEETAAMITAAGGKATAADVDVSNGAAVEAMVKQSIDAYGRIDILVNNAGISVGSDILTIDEATWDLNLNVVLKGVFLCSKAVLPGMIERGNGVIINMSSVNGLYGIGEEPYSAAKAGMINLTQNMAVKYGPQGVRVNCICPGSIQTPIWGERVAEDPQIFDKLAKWYPLRRVGQPEDVASAALFLASDESSWITGAILPVDGGLTAGNEYLGSDLGN